MKGKQGYRFGYLPELIEIPADMLLYWTLKKINFNGAVSEGDINRYRKAIVKAHQQFHIEEALAFHFPYRKNYQHELFKMVLLENGETGFVLNSSEKIHSKELLEYHLVKLASFERTHSKVVQEMFLLAGHIYEMEKPPISHTLECAPTWKKKVLHLFKK